MRACASPRVDDLEPIHGHEADDAEERGEAPQPATRHYPPVVDQVVEDWRWG